MLSDINISHGSVATLLRCGGICNDIFIAKFKFPAECNSERILKIGHYLTKLWTRVWCLVFYWTTVYIQLTNQFRYKIFISHISVNNHLFF